VTNLAKINHFTLQKQFETLEKHCGGIVGASAVHLETKREINYKSNEYFLMCSTYKLPIVIYLLHQAEQKKLDLNQLVIVNDYDLRPGAIFTLNQFDCRNGFPISIRNLLQLMMQESCNTSSDIILRLIGGPAAVTSYLKQIDINAMRIDRYILEIIAASDGITIIPEDHHCTLAQYKALELAVSKEQKITAKKLLAADNRDQSTPAAMTTLLQKLLTNQLIDAASTTFLLNIMRKNKLYPQRLMGLLPPKTPVAHKTGTAEGYTNDVGIITLPHEMGHIAISVFIKNSPSDRSINERVIAELARIAYDTFLFSASN
jgi:beta-lactamase class A